MRGAGIGDASKNRGERGIVKKGRELRVRAFFVCCKPNCAMNFSRKLNRFVQALNETFPPNAEREPTIAEDYPETWPEIQRKRLIHKGIHIAVGIFLTLLIIVRLWLGAAAIHQFYQSIFPLGPVIMGLALIFALDFAQNLKCPRCHKRFHQRSRYDFLNDPKARCQHCNLQLGEHSNEKPLR